MGNQRYVVGMDGSAGARAALRWAVTQAAGHDGDSIHAIAAWRRDPSSGGSSSAKTHKQRLNTMLATEVDALPADERSHTTISTEVAEGPTEEILVEACEDNDILVLGRHGHGKAWHILMGWTTEACVRKVACPVVIIPPEPAPATKQPPRRDVPRGARSGPQAP